MGALSYSRRFGYGAVMISRLPIAATLPGVPFRAGREKLLIVSGLCEACEAGPPVITWTGAGAGVWAAASAKAATGAFR